MAWTGSTPLVPPYVLVIGEAPEESEDLAGASFIGQSGQLLRLLLDRGNIPSAKCGYTYQNACRPPGNRVPTKAESAACRSNLELTIRVTQPGYLLLVGQTALHAFRPKAQLQYAAGRPFYVGDQVGGGKGPSRLSGGGILAMAVYHPASLLFATKDRPKLEARMKRDIDNFRHMVYEAGWEWPDACEQCALPVEFYDGQGIAFCAKHFPRADVNQEKLFK